MNTSPDSQFTPEQEILLWAIRVDHTKDQRAAEILTSGVEWAYVRETAIRHGIIPLLYKRLKGEMDTLVPPEELSALRTLFMENTIGNLRKTHHLLKVLDVLTGAGIEALPFKGPALAVQAYGDLSLRSFCDLDFLVHASDLPRVYKIMTDQKYRLYDPYQMNQGYLSNDRVLISLERIVTITDRKDLCFSFHDDILEFHWKIIERWYAVPLDMGQLWDRSLPVLINGKKITTLSPEDMVIVLCFHGHKHGWQKLNWLADLIFMISNHRDLNWQKIAARADDLGLKRVVHTGLLLARNLGGIRWGGDMEEFFALDSATVKLEREIQLSLFCGQTFESSFVTPFFFLRSRERVRDKMMFLCYFFTDLVLQLPRWLVFHLIRRQKMSHGMKE
jgi:hypothetical protein